MKVWGSQNRACNHFGEWFGVLGTTLGGSWMHFGGSGDRRLQNTAPVHRNEVSKRGTVLIDNSPACAILETRGSLKYDFSHTNRRTAGLEGLED